MTPSSSHRVPRIAAALMGATAALALAGGAQAQSVTLDTTNSPVRIDTSSISTVTVPTGSNAVIIPDGQQWTIQPGQVALYYQSNILGSNPASSPFGGTQQAAKIVTQSGSTLTFIGTQTLGWGPWVAMHSMINASGDVVLEGGTQNLVGDNTFGGNLTLKAGSQLYNGESWGAPVNLTFGANSNVTLQGNAYWFINQSNNSATIGGALAADAASVIDLSSGTLTVNGRNTAENAFKGTLNISPGATFVVGDASHTNAVFGDPNHTDGSSFTLNLTRSSTGASAVLQGYGTIYGAVNNSAGIVQPGSASGALGTLTVSQYTQGSAGTLKVAVSPTGASQLKVLGNASLDGTLNITVAPGKYSNGVYTVLSAGSITGQFSTITTSGNTSGAIVGLQSTATTYSLVTESTETTQIVPHLAAANRDHVKGFTGTLFDLIATTSTSYGAPKAEGDVMAWITPTGRYSKVTNGDTGYRATSGGVTAGVERTLAHNGKIGVAVAYAAGEVKATAATARAKVNTFDVALYGGVDLPNGRLDFVGFYNKYDADSHRTLDSYGDANGKVKGSSYGGALQLSRSLFDNAVVPFLRGTYAFNSQDGLSETGAGPLALKYDSQRLHSVTADFGLRIHPAQGGPVRPEIVLAVEHDFANAGEYVTGQFATITGSPFRYTWAGNSQTVGLGALNLTARTKSGVEFYGQVDGRFTSHQTAGAVSAGARLRF